VHAEDVTRVLVRMRMKQLKMAAAVEAARDAPEVEGLGFDDAAPGGGGGGGGGTGGGDDDQHWQAHGGGQQGHGLHVPGIPGSFG
jgi:hypothetical protein